MREAVQPALLAVARGGGEHQREAARRSRLDEAPLQGAAAVVGRADADEARDTDRVLALDERGSLIG